ncbi:hypothetical protein [Aliikangiella coralliicola]|uniref:Uncharacterized protein n=1 Tax=Aliikangiella coralliicola TaxID=2592383 RepID=A0A545UBC7_9GAMM|nr:hypothetical protein [Aliikangiella coralliicola]TQV86733.1 hypothetical protein FLL46_17740 [Aliikangiella coralliicola]
MPKQSLELIKLLKDVRDVNGATADFSLQFLRYINCTKDRQLFMSVFFNLHYTAHHIEIKLIDLGMNVLGQPYNPTVFRNIDFLSVDFVNAMKQFLENRYSNQFRTERKSEH